MTKSIGICFDETSTLLLGNAESGAIQLGKVYHFVEEFNHVVRGLGELIQYSNRHDVNRLAPALKKTNVGFGLRPRAGLAPAMKAFYSRAASVTSWSSDTGRADGSADLRPGLGVMFPGVKAD